MAIRVRDVTLDVAARLVYVNDAHVHVSTKAFDLLALLFERRPDAVSKADAHARLWPGTFVSSSSLPSLVTELRSALDDRRRNPPLIRTVHGFGYAIQVGDSDGDLRDESDTPLGWLIGSTAEIALHEGEHVLGREGEGTVPLRSSTVSRRHARLSLDGTRAMLEDLGSKNGTYVNDRQVTTPTSVGDGDQIRIGALVFTFRRTRPATTTETVMSGSGLRRS